MNQSLSKPVLQDIARMPKGNAAHLHAPAHLKEPATINATEIAGKTLAGSKEIQSQPTADEKTALKLRGVKSTFMLPAQVEFFGMLGGGALGWVARKFNWKRAEAGINMVARAPVNAMRRTTLADAMQLPANLFKEASNEAGKIESAATMGWSDAAAAKGKAWSEGATEFKREISGGTAPHLKKIGEKLDGLEGTKFGQLLHGKLSGFIKNRHTAVSKAHTAAMDRTNEALLTEGRGFFKSIKHRVTSTEAAKVEAGALDFLSQGLKHAESLPAEQKADHLKTLISSLEDTMRGESMKGEVGTRAGNVMKHLKKSFSSANALKNYEKAIEESAGLKGIVSAMTKSAGSIPVYNALLTVGIVAGLGAVLATAHGESKEAKAAFKKLSTELADAPNQGFLKVVKQAQGKSKHWGAAKTGMRMVGEVAEGGMWMMHNGGGAGMMGAMMLPQLCDMMIPGNPLLGALEALDKSDKGQLALKPADRIQLMAQIIGGMGTVAAHGGQYNRLAKSMAGEMQERGFKYHDVVQMLGNDAAFNKFAGDVSAKQQELSAKAAAEVKAAAPVTAPAVSAVAPTVNTGPSTRIGVGAVDAQHKGLVVDNRHLAMA